MCNPDPYSLGFRDYSTDPDIGFRVPLIDPNIKALKGKRSITHGSTLRDTLPPKGTAMQSIFLRWGQPHPTLRAFSRVRSRSQKMLGVDIHTQYGVAVLFDEDPTLPLKL